MTTGRLPERLLPAQLLAETSDLISLAADWDALRRRCATSPGSHASWLLPAVAAAGDDAWGLVLRQPSGHLAAAALFVDVTAGEDRVATLAGTDAGNRGGLLAADDESARALALALAEAVRQRGLGLDLGPVARDDATAGHLARAAAAELVDDEPVPHVRRGGSADIRDYLSGGTRKTLRKARNRMATDGVEPEVVFTRDATQVRAMLPAMEAVYRERDRCSGRAGALDTPGGRALWRERVLGTVRSGHGEVGVLTLKGKFAAYTLGVRDGSWYGLGEGRFDTALARYTPGRFLEAAVLQRVLDDPDLIGIDWMSAVAPESLLAANGAAPTVRLVTPAPASRLPRIPQPRAAQGEARSTDALCAP